MNDYTTSVEIPCTNQRVFKAISKELANWWGEQDNIIIENGTVFKVSWGAPWYQFKVIQYNLNHLMVWECIDANQKIENLTDVEKEWVGTKVYWELNELSNNRTLLQFKHEGLTPEFLCFNFCSDSWDHFIKGSLVEYLK